MSISINIYINYKKRRIAEMLFSHNGFSGLLFYLFLLGGLFLKLKFGVNIFSPLTNLLFIGVPLVLIFFKEPLDRLIHRERVFPGGVGGFIVEGIFELFEVVLSYLTNTMSFLRVGGFVIAHAGMMLVVFSLMEMGSSAIGSTLIFVFGNLFVMALESMIVGIQVLRLEFFEMFSRFYEGSGIPFKTIK
jgi:V/A-type H+-transporting ATPase subunit I